MRVLRAVAVVAVARAARPARLGRRAQPRRQGRAGGRPRPQRRRAAFTLPRLGGGGQALARLVPRQGRRAQLLGVGLRAVQAGGGDAERRRREVGGEGRRLPRGRRGRSARPREGYLKHYQVAYPSVADGDGTVAGAVRRHRARRRRSSSTGAGGSCRRTSSRRARAGAMLDDGIQPRAERVNGPSSRARCSRSRCSPSHGRAGERAAPDAGRARGGARLPELPRAARRVELGRRAADEGVHRGTRIAHGWTKSQIVNELVAQLGAGDPRRPPHPRLRPARMGAARSAGIAIGAVAIGAGAW